MNHLSIITCWTSTNQINSSRDEWRRWRRKTFKCLFVTRGIKLSELWGNCWLIDWLLRILIRLLVMSFFMNIDSPACLHLRLQVILFNRHVLLNVLSWSFLLYLISFISDTKRVGGGDCCSQSDEFDSLYLEWVIWVQSALNCSACFAGFYP